MTTVLVMRPSPEGEQLCAALQTAGLNTQFVPTIQIQAKHYEPVDVSQFDYTIFISPNAVRFFSLKTSWPQTNRVAVIGSATAIACEEKQIPVVTQPTQQFTSEALLALPEWQSVRKKKCLLIKGEGGREVLQLQLIALGAIVEIREVYQRLPLINADFTVEWSTIDVVIATSLEALQTMTRMQSSQTLPGLLQTPLLVSSDRLQHEAEKLGFTGPFIRSPNATTNAIVQTLIKQQ